MTDHSLEKARDDLIAAMARALIALLETVGSDGVVEPALIDALTQFRDMLRDRD